jgi:hypothetical protein
MQSLDEKEAEGDSAAAVPTAVMAAVDGAKAEAQKVSADRRSHRRVPGSKLDWLTVARVKYGPEVSVIDLSRGGVLLQSDRPLAPGSKQALEIVGTEKSVVVPFGVLRSKLTAIQAKGPVYRAACAFNRPLEIPELINAVAGPAVDEPVVAAPAPDATDTDAAAAAVAPEAVEAAAPSPTPAEAPTTMERIVARFVDGTTMKGFTNDFVASRTQLTLFQSAEPESTSVVVPFQSLKAVFFVRHFAGNPDYRERKTFCGPAQGRKIHVTFNDGETLVGTTQAYRAGGTGFYVTPADPRANNVRVFVLSSAVRQVQLP